MARISFAEICRAATDAAGLPPGELASPRRHRCVVQPRFAAVLLARRLRHELSLPWLGRRLGGRDHTTIWHANLRAQTLLAEDPAFQALVGEVVTRLALPALPPPQPLFWAEGGLGHTRAAAERRLAHLQALKARVETRIAAETAWMAELARTGVGGGS